MLNEHLCGFSKWTTATFQNRTLKCKKHFLILPCFQPYFKQNLIIMKKINLFLSLFVAFLLVAFASNRLSAQVCGQGVWMIGGEIGFNSSSSNGESFSLFSAQPMAGYFVIDNLAVGTSIGLATSDGFSEFGIGPFVRYYVWSNLFAQVGLQYTNTTIDPSDGVSSTRFGGGLGYSFFVNNAVAIEPSVQVDFGDDVTNFGIGIGIQAFIGRE